LLSTRAIPDRDVFYLGNPFPRFVVNELRRASNKGDTARFPQCRPFNHECTANRHELLQDQSNIRSGSRTSSLNFIQRHDSQIAKGV
jgi:hypothetical protein